MDPTQWVSRCADRLRRQWPHAMTEELEAAARDLLADPKWREMEPEQAAVEWLRLGVLAVAECCSGGDQ